MNKSTMIYTISKRMILKKKIKNIPITGVKKYHFKNCRFNRGSYWFRYKLIFKNT